MKKHELISISEAELVKRLKGMDTTELEQHARTLMLDLGEDNYGKVMKSVMGALKEDRVASVSAFEHVQQHLQQSLPNQAYMSDIYARLAAIIMMIISKKFSDTVDGKR